MRDFAFQGGWDVEGREMEKGGMRGGGGVTTGKGVKGEETHLMFGVTELVF